MKVEILHIDQCPNWEEADRRVRSALDQVGRHDVVIDDVLLSSSEEAKRVWFAGSPTILVDGVDAFPNGGRTTDLACRLYQTGSGLAGLPAVEQLAGVFRDHVQHG